MKDFSGFFITNNKKKPSSTLRMFSKTNSLWILIILCVQQLVIKNILSIPTIVQQQENQLVNLINGNHIPEARDFLNDNVRQLLEDLRVRMHMDMTEFNGIPRLEPFYLDYYKVENISKDLNGLEASINDVHVHGLSEFITNDAYINVTFFFNFDVSIPKLMMTGNYDAKGDIGGGIFEFKGKGPFTSEIFGINMKSIGRLGVINNAEIPWILQYVDIDFTIERSQVQFEGIQGTAAVQEFFNEAFSALGKQILELIWPDMKPIISDMMKEMIPESMKDISVIDALNIINGNGNFFPPIEP